MNLDPAVLKVPAFELSFVDGRGVLSLPAHTIGPLLFDVLELDIPDLRFPVDMTGGVRSFRHRRCTVRRANLTIDIDTLASHFHDALPKEGGLVFANLGYSAYDGGVFEIEGEVRLGAQETSFLFRGLIDPLLDGSMRVRLPELRVFAPFPIPAPLVAQTLLHAINDKRTNSHDDTSFARNFTGCCEIDVHPLALALLYTAAPMGWRLPACDDVHLATLHLTGTHLLIDYTTTAPPAPPPRRERYLEQLGAGLELFAEEEGTLAEGSLAETLNTYALRRAEQPEHPFAAERLLSLAVADPAREAEALSLAQEIEEKLPDLPAIPATRAAIAVRQGDLHTAVLEFRKLAKLATVRGHTREEFFALRAATRATLNLTDTSAILTDAITDLERILAIDPEDFEALRTLGRLYAEAGAWTHLVAIRQRQFDLTSSPEARINALIALGEISRVHLNELDVSQEHYQHALALDAGNEPALRGLAEACIEADQPRRALDALDRLCRLANERDDEAREIPLQQRVASLLEHIGNPEEALERLERVLHLDEHCVDARRRVAELLTDLGRATEAVPHLQHLLGERGGPEQRLDVHRHLATIFLHELGDLDAAEEEISGALALDELDLDALTLLRELAERRGDPSALLQSLERIAGISPPGAARSKILLELGTIYASSENRAKDAETTLARAIEHALDEGFAALRALALLYEEGNEPILAIDAWRRAVATDAGHLDVEAWRALAALEHDRGATADARDVLLKALSHIAEGPERLDLLEDLDTIYRDLHDGLARLRLLEEEIEPLLSDLMMDPRRVEILTQISTLREDSGDIDGALRSLEEASSIASENIVLLERRADIHELVGAWPAAHVVIEDALKAATQDADRARLSMRLGQILSQEGQEHPAITAYEHAIALGLDLPQEDLAWRRILDLHLRLGDPVAAAKAAEEAATQGETKARAQQIFQASQLWLKNAARPDEARRCLRQAVTLWPRHQRSLDSLESLAREDGDQQELIEVLRLKVEAAATHPPVQKALLVRLAETLATARSPEEARTAITHALNLDTNYLPALLFAARDNKSVKKSDAAQHYRHLIEALPSAPNITDTQRISILVEAHIFLAQDALEHEEEGHAEGHLEAALAAHPQQREALRALDALLIRQQRWTEALDAKHRLIPLVDDVEARGLAMAQVDILLTLDRVDDAVAHLERLIARDPQNEEALKRFDSLLREAGQRQRLLEAHEERAGRLQDQKSDSAPAWLAAADLARELGHEEQHRAYLQSAHAARPNDVQIVKALLTIIGSEDDELLVLLQRRLDLEGDAPEAANTLAKLIAATVSRGDSAGAIKALSATLTRPWVGAEEYTQCAELLVSEDRSNEAREIYATLRRRASHEEEKLRACHGLMTLTEDKDEREALAKDILAKDPDNQEAEKALLQVLSSQDRLSEVISFLRDRLIISEEPRHRHELLADLAQALNRAGRRSEAESLLRDTVDTTPTAELAPEIFAAIQDLGFDTLTLRYLDRSVPDHLQDDGQARRCLELATLLRNQGATEAAQRRLMSALAPALSVDLRKRAARLLLDISEIESAPHLAALKTLNELAAATRAEQEALAHELARCGEHHEAALLAATLLEGGKADHNIDVLRRHELAAAGEFATLARILENDAGKLSGSLRSAALVDAAKQWARSSGTIEETTRCLVDAARATPSNPAPIDTAQEIFAALGAWRRGAHLLEDLVTDVPTLSPRLQAHALCGAAALLDRAEPASESSEKLLKRALDLDRQSEEALSALIDLQRARDDNSALAQALLARADQGRGKARATDLLEAAELLAEKDPKATRELLGRIQRLPRSKALRLRLVDVWITLDDSLAAENELLLLVNDRDAAGDALRRACGLAHLRGDMDAEAHYLALRAKIDPKDTLISEQLREAYRAAGDLQGLREALTPLAAQDKQALLELADLCAGPLDAPAEAYDLYQRLLDGDSPAPPLRERAHRGLIQVSELLDRPLDLARHLATLRELLPEHAHARRGELALRRAHILAERTSLNEEALESARQAARDLGGGTPWANALRLQVSLAPPPEILKILEALATSQHARDDELVDLGRRARAATQPELAIKAYDALLKRDITHPRGEELVGLLRQEGRLREAANLLEQRAAAALTQEHETNHAADLLLDLAALRGELGQTDRRITALRQAAAASPGRRDIVKTLLAELRATDEDPSRILRTLEEQSAAAQGDLLIELLGELAELYLDLGEPAQAARTHETILRLAPKRVDLLPTLLDHAIEARQVDRARVLYDRARDTEAADDIDWLERTVSLAALEIDEDSHLPARERLESLVQREPEATSAWQLLRRLGERTQDVLLLGRAHRHLADLDPDRRQAHLRSAAAAYETLPAGRMQAQDIYQTLIALAPDDEEPWLRLETLLRDTQDPAILTAFLWRQAEHAPTLDRFLALERREAKSGAIDRSEEALRQACIVYPSHPLPLERLADRLEARHAFAELSELLSTYLETKTALEPATWGRLAIRLAKVLEEHLGLPDTAATWLVRVASTTPDNLEAPRRLIALRQRQGDVRSAIPFLQELIERSDGDVRAGLMSVLAQLQRDDLQDKAKAAETYRAAFRLSPAQHVNAGLAAIEIFEASREGPRALELIDEIMEVSPSPDLHHARGRALGNLGKLAAACQAYEHALEKPTPERHLELGLLLRRLGDDRKAASHLRRAADLFDDPVAAGEALYACGQALTTLGIRDAARQRYEEATEHDPGLRLAWAALLPLVSREREPKIFSHVLDALEALSPPGADRAELRFQRSEQARDEGNLEQAATHLEEALSDDPKHRASLHRLRDISLGAGSWSRAAELLRSEIEISDSEKERALLHRKLGILLERRLNANAEGLEHLRLASSIDPSVDNRQALLTALDRDGDHRAAARLALTLAREVEGSFGRESTLRAAQCYERAQDPDTARSLYAELAPLDDEVGRRAAARLADLDADRHDADRHDDWKEDEHQTRPLPNLIDVLDQLIADKAWPRVVDEISTRISQSSDPKTQADLHLTLARVLENELDQPKEALEAFDAAAELAPELSEVLEQAADAAYRHQRFRRARELYDQLWESSATLDRAEIAYRRGTIYEALGYEATANHCYAETLTFEANHRMALEARARLAIYRDDPQAAIEVFLQLSRVIGPTEPQRLAELRISLGELYLSQGETEKARARLEAALALDQHNEHALRLLLAVYEELGEHRAAADIAETLAAQIDDPLVRASLLHHRAMLLGTHLANEEEAINCLFRAYDIAPRHIPTLWRLVDYYWQEDDLASVRQMGNDLRAADALVAETPDTRQMTIALAFIADGMIEPSKTLFRAVLSDATLHESALQELVHGLVLGVDAKIIAAILHDIDGHEAFIEKAKALHEEGPSKTVIAPLLDALSAL